MFELKYNITDADVKAAGKKANMRYVVMYMAVAAVGLAVGITSLVLRPDTFMLAAGIILTVMSVFLIACALVLLFAKTTLDSIVPTGENELTVTVAHENITVADGDKVTTLMYENMTGLKKQGNDLVVFFGKTRVLIVKNNIVSGGDMSALYEYIEKRAGRALPPDNN